MLPEALKTKPKCVVCVWGPGTGKCGSTVTNTGNVCFTKGCQINVCGKWYSCPPLSPGQGCSFKAPYCFQSSDYGNFTCRATAYCYPAKGNGVQFQGYCNTQVSSGSWWSGWSGWW